MLTKEETLKVLSVLNWAIHTESCADAMMTDDVKEAIQIIQDEIDRHKEVKIKDIKCPTCDGPMISRYNRTTQDKFWGCKKYPECKGTRDSMGRSREERQAWKESQQEKAEVTHQEGFPFRKS